MPIDVTRIWRRRSSFRASANIEPRSASAGRLLGVGRCGSKPLRRWLYLKNASWTTATSTRSSISARPQCRASDLQLAAAAGLSPRTFARRVHDVTGHSPVRFLQRLRVERAVELAATTRLPVEEVARYVDYAEASTLRCLLRREGRSVGAMRAKAISAFAA